MSIPAHLPIGFTDLIGPSVVVLFGLAFGVLYLKTRQPICSASVPGCDRGRWITPMFIITMAIGAILALALFLLTQQIHRPGS